jgi:hypothetical protein
MVINHDYRFVDIAKDASGMFAFERLHAWLGYECDLGRIVRQEAHDTYSTMQQMLMAWQ